MPAIGRRRRGVTLVELLIAMVLTGILLMSATRIMSAVADGSTRARRDAEAAIDAGIGSERIARLIYNTMPPTDSTPALVGSADSITLVSRCPLPNGWLHRCRLLLEVRRNASVQAHFDNQVVSARMHIGAVVFRYLGDSVADWRREWRDLSLPRAVGLIGATDTIVIPVGPAR